MKTSIRKKSKVDITQKQFDLIFNNMIEGRLTESKFKFSNMNDLMSAYIYWNTFKG